MKAAIVRIGNSHGVRIPKPILQQCGFGDEVEMTVSEGRLVLSAPQAPRQGWDRAFERMALAGDDEPLLDEALPNEFDDAEWRW